MSFEQKKTRPSFERSRLVAWLVLGLPLLIYVLVWPVRARLDKGVIEKHFSGQIWKRMAESLPGMEPQWLIDGAFWIGLVAFMAGSLCAVWLALDGAGRDDSQILVSLELPPTIYNDE